MGAPETKLNSDIAWRWLAKLVMWIVFVLGLALLRQDLHPTWAEIGWLIGPAIVFVGLCVLGSYGLAHLRLARKLKASARAHTAATDHSPQRQLAP